ncbi:MAG: TldD/PmbA family protein [Tenericutes bacterium HGW-Tenericutes-6]|jgi:PmbA protein|nr:MAG: TldD/PmbA family protein [Tenericutes bacterium HGW-Tenericutes-6]
MYQSWILLGKEKGITDLEVFAVRNKSLKLSVYEGKVDQHVQSDVEVVTIRGIVENKLSTIRYENLSQTNVSEMLDQLILNAKALTVVEPAIIYEGSKSYPEVKDELFDFGSVPVIDKINLLKNLESKILENKKVKQVQSTQYQEIDTETTLVNSKGLNLSRHNTYAYAYAIGVFAENEDIQTAYDVKLAKTFDEFDADKMAQKTIDIGVKKLGGKSIPSGHYKTVFSNEMFADLLSVFTSIFSGESAYRNMTSLKDKVGKEIADKRFNLIDDPLFKDALFKMPFDDEGVACSKRYVIENGVFKGFNHNLKTAAIFKESPTGNGFHGSIAPTNLYLEPGQKSFDEMISTIKEGVYITDLVGLHAGVKQVSGDFSLQASGFKIKDGKLDHAVKMIVISGNFFKAINDIDEIGSDLKFTIQGVGSPSVSFKSLVVGGE